MVRMASRKKPLKSFEANGLDDAYNKGYFEGSISRYTLVEGLRRRNPTIRFHSNETHTGVFDGNKFVCGIAKGTTVPRYSIFQERTSKMLPVSDEHGNILSLDTIHTDEGDSGKMLIRGWEVTLRILRGKGYVIKENDFS